jgi:hypothetical protein
MRQVFHFLATKHERDCLSISQERNGTRQNDTKAEISGFVIGFENLIDILVIEWLPRTGDLIPNIHKLY